MKENSKPRFALVLALLLCLAACFALTVGASETSAPETEAVCSSCGGTADLNGEGLCSSCASAGTDKPVNPIMAYLQSHAPLVLFICIGLGTMVGKLKIKSFVVGATAGTLLVGLVISQLVSVELPGALSSVFFSLFCFTVGFEAGPSFFASLKNSGLKIVALAAFFAFTGLGVTFLVAKLAGLDVGTGVGLMAGALTQTSIIGAAQLDPDMASNATVAYALTYVFGTLGVILFLKNLAPLILRENLPQMVQKKLNRETGGGVSPSAGTPKEIYQLRAYAIQADSAYAGKTVDDFEREAGDRVEIEAVYRDGELLSLTEELTLLAGDIIQVVGDVEALNLADNQGLGEVSDSAYYQVQVVSRKIVLANDFTEENLTLLSQHGVLLTNRKHGQLPKKGSTVSVTGSEKAIREVAKALGYIKQENETDIAVLSLAVAVGLFVGSLALTLRDLSLSLGESVGVLLVGLVCGWYYNSKPRKRGQMPEATRMFLRMLGLNLYIGALALRVGGSFQQAMSSNGWIILALGVVVTLVPHLLSLLFGKFILRIEHTDLLGGLSGAGTCTAALNALNEETGNSVFSQGYATGCAIGNILLTVMGLLLPLLF